MTTKDKLASAHTRSGRCAARSVDQSTAVVGDTSGRRCAFGTTGRIVSRASTIRSRVFLEELRRTSAGHTEGDFVQRPECLATRTFR